MDEAPVREGDVLAGKYRIERVLGIGGMGVVVAATHLQLDQRVALKFLLPEALASQEVVARFAREARAAAKIQSEHVARVIDVGTLETGSPYMVMEYLEGRDLSAVAEERGALPSEEVVGYVLQACEALAEAHAAGIVHRDLKPANLFLAERADKRAIIKVLDFGISKATGKGEDVSLTRTSTVMGSPLYMSPEQMASAKMVDQRSDIWALGVILYELVTGVAPFFAETMTEVIAKILMHPPAPFGDANVSPELLAVINRCLEKTPDKRYQNVGELADALAPFAPSTQQGSADRVTRVLGTTRMPMASSPDNTAAAAEPSVPGTPVISLPTPSVQGSDPAILAKLEVAKTNASWGKTGDAPAPGASGNRTNGMVVAVLLALAIAAVLLIVALRKAEPLPSAASAPVPPTPVTIAAPSIASPAAVAAPAAPPSVAPPVAVAPVVAPSTPPPAKPVRAPAAAGSSTRPGTNAAAPPPSAPPPAASPPPTKNALQIDLK